jgi:hypothetical protein
MWHEWGHFSGAIASRAKSRTVHPKGLSLVRFRFDFDVNDSRQFHLMTLGGQIAQWLLVLLVLLAIPMDAATRVALLAGAAKQHRQRCIHAVPIHRWWCRHPSLCLTDLIANRLLNNRPVAPARDGRSANPA